MSHRTLVKLNIHDGYERDFTEGAAYLDSIVSIRKWDDADDKVTVLSFADRRIALVFRPIAEVQEMLHQANLKAEFTKEFDWRDITINQRGLEERQKRQAKQTQPKKSLAQKLGLKR